MQELTVRDILKILKKRWWLIVAFCILVTAAAGIYYRNQPNEYTAQAMLLVLVVYEDSQQQTRYDMYVSEQLAADFKVLLDTRDIMEKSRERMGAGQEEFSAIAFDINADTGTRILRLSATGRDRSLCMQAANTVSLVFAEYIQNWMTKCTVNIVEEAELPKAASGPSRMRNTLLAGAVSFMLAMGAVLAMEMLNTTLRSAGAVENTLGLPVLASIQNYRKEIAKYMQKHPPGEMLPKAVSVVTKENIRTLAANVQFAAVARPTRSLIVTSTVSGEGKSSLLLLLAEALADLGKRVLVVDMDMRNPSLWRYVGARGRNDLFDYLVGHSRLEEVICKTGNPGIHFIDSRHRLASVSQIVNFEVFDKFLDAVKRSYDLVLFDTPPMSLFIDAAALANKMDAALMVVGNGMADKALIGEAVEQLHKANANILGAALNFVDNRRTHRHYYGKAYGYTAEKKDAAVRKPLKEM